jgi:hypothetical protein
LFVRLRGKNQRIQMTNNWWLLGEFVNYIHVMMIGGMLLGGGFWIRPIWLWLVGLVTMVISWPLFFGGQCPITKLSNWMQGTDWYSFFSNFGPTYGRLWGTIIPLVLFALSVWLAVRFRQPADLFLPQRWKDRSAEDSNKT